MLDKARFLAIKVEGLKAPAANILKQEMLSVGGDASVARGVINCSAELSSSVIMGTRKQIKNLVKKLKAQPFGLKVLADELTELLRAEEGPFKIEWPGGTLDLSERVAVMGIINVTPDSFSDGNDNFRYEDALASALEMVGEGADILDIGGESTRPGAEAVPLEEELKRVLPLVEYLAPRVKVPISVDTYKAQVAGRAVEAGASIVNDVSGLRLDPEMASTVAKTGANVVVMHMRGVPRDMQSDTHYEDLTGEVYASLAGSVKLALEAGVAHGRIIVDPGIGFGKSVDGNLALLRRLPEFTSLGLPVLVGASRKSFIGKVLGIENPKERLEGSLSAASLSVLLGANIIRAHDVRETRRAVDLAWAVKNAGRG
ncbi:dihydropteroate synthase [bacterium]|nr:MAG: dihydropteroate synthase [bacterium]